MKQKLTDPNHFSADRKARKKKYILWKKKILFLPFNYLFYTEYKNIAK